MNLEATGRAVVDAALAVHRTLGPGLLESAYEQCLGFELLERGHAVERQKELPLIYRGNRMDLAYRLDLLVDGQVIVEVKSVDRLEPVHEAQLISYLRLSRLHLGYLINFNTRLLKDGLRRIVHELPQPS